MQTTGSRNANGLARPAAIVAPVWTHIAPVQQPRAGRIRLAEAENGNGETGTRDRGPGPGPFQGRGRGRETEGASQGLGQDPDLASGPERVLTRGPAPPRAPVPVLLLAQDLAQSHGHDRGRATGEVGTENALADLALEAGPGVAAGVAAGSASVEERGAVRRIERRENGVKMGRHRLRWATSGVNMGLSASLTSFQKRRNSVLGL